MKKRCIGIWIAGVLVLAAVCLTACDRDVPPDAENPPSVTDEDGNSISPEEDPLTKPFFTAEQIAAMTENEKRILKAYTCRPTVEEITLEQLQSVRQVEIIGNFLSSNGHRGSINWKGEYSYRWESYPLDNNIGESLDVLRYFPCLQDLMICYNLDVKDFSFLSELKELRNLTLIVCDVTELSLENLEKLEQLELIGVPIETLTLSRSGSLKSVHLEHTKLSDLMVFDGLQSSLVELMILYNRVPIQNTQLFKTFVLVERLGCIAPETDFSFLQNLRMIRLRQLYIGGSDNISLYDMTCLAWLDYIWIDHCKGIDLRPLDDTDVAISLLAVTAPIYGERNPENDVFFAETAYGQSICGKLYEEEGLYDFLG